MATFASGHGGYITVGGTRLDVTEWQLNKTARLAEVTNSGSGGVVKRHKIVEDAQFTIQVPWDSENIPDTDISLDVGDEPALVLYVGDSGKTYSFTGIVESVQPVVNNQNDIVRMTVTGYANGVVTDPVT